jgi:hypothetical protein
MTDHKNENRERNESSRLNLSEAMDRQECTMWEIFELAAYGLGEHGVARCELEAALQRFEAEGQLPPCIKCGRRIVGHPDDK